MADSDLQKIIREHGGARKVAEGLKITVGAVYGWHRVPAERVLDVERIIRVSRHVLRPDLYPLPADSDAGARQ